MTHPCLHGHWINTASKPEARGCVPQIVNPPTPGDPSPSQCPLERGGVQLLARGRYAEQIIGRSVDREGLDQGQHTISDRNPTGPTRLGYLDLYALRSGTLDDEDRKRDFDEVADPNRPQLRPAEPGPRVDEQQVRQSLIALGGIRIHLLKLVLAQRKHLRSGPEGLGHPGRRDGVRQNHPLTHRPGEERRQRVTEPANGGLRQSLFAQRDQGPRYFTVRNSSDLERGEGSRHEPAEGSVRN